MSFNIPNLTIAQKFDRLTKIANQTEKEAQELLDTYGRAFVVRPTGFGKTRLIVKMAKQRAVETKKRVLYVYPLDIIKVEIMGKKDYLKGGTIKKYVDFKSYHYVNKHIEDLKESLEKEYSMIILDEAHRAGAEGFKVFYEEIKHLISSEKIHLLGATATPNRMFDDPENNVLQSIFDGKEVSKFTLADCIIEGIMNKPIMATCKYDIDDFVKQFKQDMKSKTQKSGKQFNEENFEMELSRVMKEIGGAPKFIYKYFKEAGYSLKDSKRTSYKFIMYFRDIKDMAERSEMVENWFISAFNDIAKKEDGIKKDYNIKTYFVASSDTQDKELSKLVANKPKSREFFKQAKKVSGIKDEPYTINLLMTVDMINMGYHVEGITGVGRLRGTKSEIVHDQQIGRALSVMNDKSAIIYNFVPGLDMKDWSKEKTKGERIIADIIRGDKTDYDEQIKDIDLMIVEDEDAIDSFLSRWSDVRYSENSEIRWMYESRNAPICAISADTGKSCKQVIDILVSMGAKLRSEDDMFDYVHEKEKTQEMARFILSKKALNFIKQLKMKIKTIFDIVRNLK